MQYCSYISNTPACWNTCVSFNQSDIIYSCHLWIKRFPSTCTCTSHMQCTLFSISAILKYVARIHRSSAFQFRGTDHFSNKWHRYIWLVFYALWLLKGVLPMWQQPVLWWEETGQRLKEWIGCGLLAFSYAAGQIKPAWVGPGFMKLNYSWSLHSTTMLTYVVGIWSALR